MDVYSIAVVHNSDWSRIFITMVSRNQKLDPPMAVVINLMSKNNLLHEEINRYGLNNYTVTRSIFELYLPEAKELISHYKKNIIRMGESNKLIDYNPSGNYFYRCLCGFAISCSDREHTKECCFSLILQ